MRFKIRVKQRIADYAVECYEENKEDVLLFMYSYKNRADATTKVAFILSNLSTLAFKIVASSPGDFIVFEPKGEYDWFKITEDRKIP